MAWGARLIERCTGIIHNSVINGVKETGKALPETEAVETIPEVGEIEELQTFVGSKKTSSLYRHLSIILLRAFLLGR